MNREEISIKTTIVGGEGGIRTHGAVPTSNIPPCPLGLRLRKSAHSAQQRSQLSPPRNRIGSLAPVPERIFVTLRRGVELASRQKGPHGGDAVVERQCRDKLTSSDFA